MLRPDLYSKSNKIILEANKFCIEKYKNLLKWRDKPSILEFGIGDGSNSRKVLLPNLPEDFKEFVGTDISKNMVQFVGDNMVHPKMKLGYLDIQAGNVPICFENRFDNIFGFFIIHWLKYPGQAFSNMLRMLKPGGQIFVTFVEKTGVDDVFETLSKHVKWKKYGHENLISRFYNCKDTKGTVEKFLKDVGFTDYICESQIMALEHTNEKSFNDLHLAVNTILPKIPKQESDEYETDFLNLLKNGQLNSVVFSMERKENVFYTNLNVFTVIASKPAKNC